MGSFEKLSSGATEKLEQLSELKKDMEELIRKSRELRSSRDRIKVMRERNTQKRLTRENEEWFSKVDDTEEKVEEAIKQMNLICSNEGISQIVEHILKQAEMPCNFAKKDDKNSTNVGINASDGGTIIITNSPLGIQTGHIATQSSG